MIGLKFLKVESYKYCESKFKCPTEQKNDFQPLILISNSHTFGKVFFLHLIVVISVC